MSPDRTCQPIEWHIWKQCNANRSVGLTDRTAVRSANLKGSTTIIHKHILHIKGRNNPLEEPADRASRPIEWMFERTFKPIEQPTRSNCCPIEWPTRSKYIVYFFRVTHRCVIELFRLTYSQCSLQSTTNHCEYTRSLFAFSTFGCYIRNLSKPQTTQTIWTLTYLHVLLV